MFTQAVEEWRKLSHAQRTRSTSDYKAEVAGENGTGSPAPPAAVPQSPAAEAPASGDAVEVSTPGHRHAFAKDIVSLAAYHNVAAFVMPPFSARHPGRVSPVGHVPSNKSDNVHDPLCRIACLHSCALRA